MIFRGFQLTTTTHPAFTDSRRRRQRQRRPLAPSLLDDPAFSPDPHSHPDFVTTHEPEWLFPPPGHPILKSKNRFINSFQTIDDDQGDTITTHCHQLIQPPNSPVTVADPDENPHFPFILQATATSSLTAIKRNPISFQTEGVLTLLPPPSITPPSPPHPGAPSHRTSRLPKFNKKFMPFLSRRKSVKPQPPSASQSTSTSSTAKPSHLTSTTAATASLSSKNYHLTAEPAVPQQAVGVDPTVLLRPAFSNEQRTHDPGRTANTEGKNPPSTSRKSSVTGSAASKRLPNGLGARLTDLDRIDELDNSNPWGVSLHHGGPYEAAVKAIRRVGAGERKMPLGIPGSSAFHDYHRRAMEAHGNAYVPPHAPIGVSLNLSPGQILPRNFNASEGLVQGPLRRENPPQPVLMMRPKPSTTVTMIAETSINAFSPPQVLPPFVSRPPPQPIPQITVVHEVPSHPTPQSQRPLDAEIMRDTRADDTALIGMAMFSDEPEPSSATHLTDSDDYDPYDPIHLERSHSTSRTPSPFIDASSVPVSRALTPEPAQVPIMGPDGSTSDLTLIGSTADDRSHPPTPNAQPQISLPEPPPYSNLLEPANPWPIVSEAPSPPQTRDVNSIPIMGRQQGMPIVIQPFEQPSNDAPKLSMERRPAESSNRMQYPRDASGTPPQQMPRDAYTQLQPQHMPREMQNPPRLMPTELYAQYTPTAQEAQSESQHMSREMQNPPPTRPMPRELYTQYTPPAQEGQHGSSRGRAPPHVSSEVDRDARSTHPSISTQASSMQRYGPPRHQPRHLVMPAPLNTGGPVHPSRNQPPSGPPAAAVHGHYQQRSRQMTMPTPLAPRGAGPMRPITAPMTPMMPAAPRAQELVMNNGRGSKLKKRVSLFGSSKQAPQPPQKAPVLTTVSFAPPIIAFERGRGDEKMLIRANTERLPPASGPKRFLSKRQSNV